MAIAIATKKKKLIDRKIYQKDLDKLIVFFKCYIIYEINNQINYHRGCIHFVGHTVGRKKLFDVDQKRMWREWARR